MRFEFLSSCRSSVSSAYSAADSAFSRSSCRFWEAIQNYNLPIFKAELLYFCILVTILVLVQNYQSYFRQMLSIHWRRWLTDSVMQDWMNKGNYYRLQLTDKKTDNPDQRRPPLTGS